MPPKAKRKPDAVLTKKMLAPVQPIAPAAPVRIIRDAGFAQRLATACDHHAHVPPLHAGRLVWVRSQLAQRFGTLVSMETVRKWFYGETRPRPDKMVQMAQLLEVDEAWLSLGHDPELQPRERKARNATADGAVNLLAGIIQMNGGSPAFPEQDDKRAAKAHIDLYAIIKGAQYAFHVSLAHKVPEGWRFTVSSETSDLAFQMGIIHVDSTVFHFVEISDSLIEDYGTRRGGSVEVTLTPKQVEANRITNFKDRL